MQKISKRKKMKQKQCRKKKECRNPVCITYGPIIGPTKYQEYFLGPIFYQKTANMLAGWEEERRNGLKILKSISMYVLLYLITNNSELRIVWIIIEEIKLIDFKFKMLKFKMYSCETNRIIGVIRIPSTSFNY